MDTRIALGIQPLNLPDPSAPLQKAMTLQALMGQHELQGLQIGNARRESEKSAAYDALARRSRTQDEFLAGLDQIDPKESYALRIKLRKDQADAAKSSMDLTKAQWEATGQLVGPILTASPAQQPALYAQARQKALALGLPGADKYPEQWSPDLIPALQATLQQSMSAKDLQERVDYAGTATPGPATPIQSVDASPEHDENVIAMQNEMSAAGLEVPNAQMPTVEVNDRAGWNADDWQKEGFRLRKIGTKVANEQAKEAFTQAKNIEDAEFKKRDLFQPVGGGVTFNKATNEYLIDGRKATAAEIQKIENTKASKGAMNVNLSSMTPEAAAKTELLNQGISDMVEFKSLVMPNGKVDRAMIAGLNAPGFAGVPGTDSRTAYSLIYNAVEAKLRAESGAAVPDTEVKRMADRFIPSIMDSDATVKSKLDRMDAFLRGSFGRIKNAGESSEDQKARETPKRRASDKAPVTEFTQDEIAAEMARRGLK